MGRKLIAFGSKKMRGDANIRGHHVRVFVRGIGKVADPYTVFIDDDVFSIGGKHFNQYIGSRSDSPILFVLHHGKKVHWAKVPEEIKTEIMKRLEG